MQKYGSSCWSWLILYLHMLHISTTWDFNPRSISIKAIQFNFKRCLVGVLWDWHLSSVAKLRHCGENPPGSAARRPTTKALARPKSANFKCRSLSINRFWGLPFKMFNFFLIPMVLGDLQKNKWEGEVYQCTNHLLVWEKYGQLGLW